MTVTTARKYNPGFLSDDELVASFCVRTCEFESIVEMLRECTGNPNKHQIVIGPRGSGKTSLLLRVAAEVRRNADLAASFFPIVFAEESYEVGTAGEFWLECLARLADQAPEREGAPDLHRTVDDLRTIRDDQSLGERCLASVLDFADREDKRLVLMVENLNMMFRDMIDRDAGWRLRKVLQTEPRIILLASATSRFDEIDQQDHALYEQLREITLHRLTTEECAVLWETVSGQKRPPGTIRSLEILTGGSPRLLAIVARFGAGLSFQDLMENLLDLVDDHTEYFKSHLEALPPQERRVYLAVADLWKPALTKEVAERARIDTSQCSAQLKRLVERGAVLVAGGSARRKQYYLSERMYNIYYLMRRSRGQERLIEVLIRFMVNFYPPDELKEIGTRVAREADDAAPEMRALYHYASAELVAAGGLARPPAESGVDSAENMQVLIASILFNDGVELAEQNRLEDAVAAFEELLRRFGETDTPELMEGVAKAFINKGIALGQLNRPEEELAAYDEVLRRFDGIETPSVLQQVAIAAVNKGIMLGQLNRPEEELTAYDDFLRRFGAIDTPDLLEQVTMALNNKGVTLAQLNRPTEALAAYEETLHRCGGSEDPKFLERGATVLNNQGAALSQLNRPEEALAAYGEVLQRFGESETLGLLEQVAIALNNKGGVLRLLHRPDEALTAYDEALRRLGTKGGAGLLEQAVRALNNKGATLGQLNRPEEALAVFDEALRRLGDSEDPKLLEQVAKSLNDKGVALGQLNRPEEALAAYDEVLRQFVGTETPGLLEQVAKALNNKGVTLEGLNRLEESLATHEEAVRRLTAIDGPEVVGLVPMALISKGTALRQLNRPEEALAAYEAAMERAEERKEPIPPKWAATTYVNKLQAVMALNRPVKLRDIEALLEMLPTLNTLPGGAIEVLMELSIEIGPNRMLKLIQNSPAVFFLLPLTTALEREAGLAPRVSEEVSEVAEDVRIALAEMREARSN